MLRPRFVPIFRRRIGAALIVAATVSSAGSAAAETPRHAVDLTIGGLTCSTTLDNDPSTTQPVTGTSSARVRLTVPKVAGTNESILVRGLRVDLTTNAGADLAARGGFETIKATTTAVVHWSSQAPDAPVTYTDYDGALQPIGGDIATNVFTTRAYDSWVPVPSTAAPLVASLRQLKGYATVSPGNSASFTCEVPPGPTSEFATVPVRDDLPFVTSISQPEIRILQPTIVTIRGRNFRNVRAIDTGLSGRTTLFWVNSSTQITALIVPVKWGYHPIGVVTPTHTSVPTTTNAYFKGIPWN